MLLSPISVDGCKKRGEPVVADFAMSVEEDDNLAGSGDGTVVTRAVNCHVTLKRYLYRTVT